MVEQDSRLLAYLRVFDREVRVGGAALSVASIVAIFPEQGFVIWQADAF